MKKHQIKFTPSARSHFLDGISYINKNNPIAAKKFRQKVEKKLKRLIEFPDSGKVIREYPDLPFREIVIPPYRFFYRIKESLIWIVAVYHSAQEIDNPT